jgi:hypothetical protein
MNIFVLDQDPTIAARYHNDRHVVKMILEAAQMMFMAHVFYEGGDYFNAAGGEEYFNKLSTLEKYTGYLAPRWVRATTSNYDWTWLLAKSLLHEFEDRYKHAHSYKAKIERLKDYPTGIPEGSLRPFVQSMPQVYRRHSAVEAYRLYYMHEKAHLAEWRPPSSVPAWFTPGHSSRNQHAKDNKKPSAEV